MLSSADVKNHLERVQNRTGLDADDVWRKIETKLCQVFPVSARSVIVAGMDCHGRAHIYAASGDLQELLAALPHLENWYRARGALRLTVAGRVGWRRKLKGYHQRGDILFKEL